jgi:hypothetical protein
MAYREADEGELGNRNFNRNKEHVNPLINIKETSEEENDSDNWASSTRINIVRINRKLKLV